jgi:hypothetical protein
VEQDADRGYSPRHFRVPLRDTAAAEFPKGIRAF